MEKRGVSPVIATVLLVVIVVVLILIIFIWARGIIGEVVQKQDRNIEQVCGEVNLRVVYDSVNGNLQITNEGNIPVYGLELRKTKPGAVEAKRVGGEDGKLSIGQSKVVSSDYAGTGYEVIEVFPVLLGEAESGKKAYTCKNHGVKAYA
jgi:flagellin-like protein